MLYSIYTFIGVSTYSDSPSFLFLHKHIYIYWLRVRARVRVRVCTVSELLLVPSFPHVNTKGRSCNRGGGTEEAPGN